MQVETQYLLSLPLPGFLSIFANNVEEVAIGAAPVAHFTNLQFFQVIAVLLIFFLLLEVGLVGVFLGMDLFLFYVFW